MFYAMATKPEFWKRRINLFVALAPAVKILTPGGVLTSFGLKFGGIVERRLEKAGIYELFGQGWSQKYGFIRRLFPVSKKIEIRSDMMNYDLDNEERTKMLMGHFPHGTSARSLNHFGQLIQSKEFRLYDYGKKENIKKYGQD